LRRCHIRARRGSPSRRHCSSIHHIMLDPNIFFVGQLFHETFCLPGFLFLFLSTCSIKKNPILSLSMSSELPTPIVELAVYFSFPLSWNYSSCRIASRTEAKDDRTYCKSSPCWLSTRGGDVCRDCDSLDIRNRVLQLARKSDMFYWIFLNTPSLRSDILSFSWLWSSFHYVILTAWYWFCFCVWISVWKETSLPYKKDFFLVPQGVKEKKVEQEQKEK